MRKSIVWILSLALVPVVASWLGLPAVEKNNEAIIDWPAPTGTMMMHDSISEKEHQQQREAWLKGMQKAAPGVNPERLEHEYRFERQRRLASRSSVTSLAGGKVQGQFAERGCNFHSGCIRAVEWDTVNDVMYVQTSGGILFAGPEDGSNWQPVNEHLSMGSGLFIRLVEHNGGQRLLAGMRGSWFYYSDDLGQTWDTADGLQQIAPQYLTFILDVILLNDSARTMYLMTTEWLGTHHRLYRSTDHGATFDLLFEFPTNVYGHFWRVDLWAHRYEEAAYMILGDSVFELTGDTSRYFRGVVPGATSTTLITGYASPTDTNDILYVYTDYDIYRSADGGVNWTYQGTLSEPPWTKMSFECSVADQEKLYFGGVNCWRSWDQGQNWFWVNHWNDYGSSESTKLHADIPNVQSFWDDHGNEVLLISTDASFYASTDNGLTVNNLGLSGLNASRMYDHLSSTFEPGVIYVGTQDQGYQRVQQDTGGILTFDQVGGGDYGWLCSSDGGHNLWMTSPGLVAHWIDAPYGWAQPAVWFHNGVNTFWMPPLMADPYNGHVAYLAGGNLTGAGSASHMIRLEDHGGGVTDITATQLPYDFNQNGGGNVSAMAYSPIDPDHWYVLTDNGKFYHSSDAGVNWTQHHIPNAPGGYYLYGMTIYPSPVDLGTVYIGGSGYSNPAIYKTDNHGAGFVPMSNGLPPTLVHEIAGDPTDSLLFAATRLGPFVYVSSEDEWYDLIPMGMPDVLCWSVEYVNAIDVARFGTYARGLWDLNLETTIGLTEQELAEWKVYPNPTRDQVRFSEVLETGMLADLNGRVVRQWNTPIDRLDVSDLPAGRYILRSGQGAQVVVKF